MCIAKRNGPGEVNRGRSLFTQGEQSRGDAANEWHLIMATAMLALLPPALVVVLMQKWFVKGLVETEK